MSVGFARDQDGYSEEEFAIAELCDLVEGLLEYLHPDTGHEEPGEREVYERAEQLLTRYRDAT